MLLFRSGLYLASAMACLTTWWSSQAGYAVEVAMLRGLVAFMAVCFLAYLAELMVVTAPLPQRPSVSGDSSRQATRDPGDGSAPGSADALGSADEPVSLPAVRLAPDAAGDRRAA